MNTKNKTIKAIFFLILFGCEANQTDDKQKFDFEFQNGREKWVGDFADYPKEPNVEDFYELEFQHSILPNPLDRSKGALRQSGNNHSDDLFMFIKRKVSGLEANRQYEIRFTIEIATDVADGMIGVGGSPGESVYIKAGASTIEPQKFLNTDNHYRMNIDKGNQAEGGENMMVIGDFANGTNVNQYTLKTLSSQNTLQIQADENGELWLIVGTDSGFEATTTIFYNSIRVQID